MRNLAGNITIFDPPGSSFTIVGAINDAGTILGASNSPDFPNYLRDAAGNFSTFSVPGSDSTDSSAINNAGTVAGTFVADGLTHGFLRDAAGNFTTFDIPGFSSFDVTAINDLGMVAGTVSAGGQPEGLLREGFLRDAAGNVTIFNPLPGGSVGNVLLNNAGMLAGTINDNSHSIGFVETQSVILPPTVISVQRFGLHAAPTSIVLGFSTALDPIHAQDVHNYSIVGPGGQSIVIDSAAYSPVTNTVVLRPHHRLNLHYIYRLTVNGSGPGGVMDKYGNLLDGVGNGLPGSNFVTNLTASNLVLGSQVPGGPVRLAYLQRRLSKIEAIQSKQLARLHHSSNTHTATQRRPVSALSASQKPTKISVRHARPPIRRSAVAR